MTHKISKRTLYYKNILIIISFLIIISNSKIYSYSKCNSTSILNTATLQCTKCEDNKIPNTNQFIPNQCICDKGYFPIDNGACSPYNLSPKCQQNQYIKTYSRDGSILTPTCDPCNQTAYPNTNGTGCTPCYTQMKYNQTLKKCQCIDPLYIQTQFGCFPQSYTSALGLTLTSSTYSSRLKYLVPGCYYFKDQLSCSQLINLCTYSLYTLTPQCIFFTKSNLTSYILSDTTESFKLTTVTKDSSLKMKIVYFLPEGNYVKQKDFKLADIMRCGLPSSADSSLEIGNNIDVSCSFNFNNLVAQIGQNSYKSYVYQLFIQGQNNAYYQVKAYLNGNSQAVKRFFLEDIFTFKTSINILTYLKFELTLNSDGHLVEPSLYLSYKKLSVESGVGITPSSEKDQIIKYNFLFTSDLDGFWSVMLPIFIVVNILIIIYACVRTYINYLNRKTPFLFFLNFIDVWSFWMFYFLMVITGYWFLFTKTTSTIYTFISLNPSLYVAFYIIFALMVLFRLIVMIITKNDKLNIQIFMINWQNGKFRNSWRQIFIVNNLAQFCTYRTFSVFWLMIIMLFFMIGVKWEKHSAEVITTDLSLIQYFNSTNKIFLYFLSSTILLVISIIFKILRRLTVLVWPYPIQDFIDYCSVTNISFFFMKKRSPQAYYLHASLPDQTDVSYKKINHAIKSGIDKNRSIFNQLSEHNQKMYIMYIDDKFQQKFNQMLKKQQDQDHMRNMKYAIASNNNNKNSNNNPASKHPFYFRQQFIQKHLKKNLQDFVQKKYSKDQTKTKSSFQSFFHIPPVDLRKQKDRDMSVIFDDKLDLLKQVFPNGDEFQEIHTIIIIYLLWIIVTGSSPIAAFLTYFCDQYLINGWIRSSYKTNLQKMTRVKQGFMM